MPLKHLASAALFAVFGIAALGAQAGTSSSASRVMQYHYGDRLDIQKVLSVQNEQRDTCGVVNTRMDYLDSQGQPQSIEYRTYATSGCHDN